MPGKGKGVNIQYMSYFILLQSTATSSSGKISQHKIKFLSRGPFIGISHPASQHQLEKEMLLETGVGDELVPDTVGQRDLTLLEVSGLWPPSWPPPWWPRWRRGCRPGWLSPRAALPGTRHRIWPHFDCSSKPPWPEKYCCLLRKVLPYHPSRAVRLLSWFWPSWHSKSSQLCPWGAEHFQIIFKKTFLCYLSLPPCRHSEHKRCHGKCPVDADGASQRQDRLQVQAIAPPLKYQSISALRSTLVVSARQLMFMLAFNSCLWPKLVAYLAVATRPCLAAYCGWWSRARLPSNHCFKLGSPCSITTRVEAASSHIPTKHTSEGCWPAWKEAWCSVLCSASSPWWQCPNLSTCSS